MENVKLQYDHLPKYCMECKLQGHEVETCRVLHPELRPATKVPRHDKSPSLEMQSPQKQARSNYQAQYPPKMLTSGKIVGDVDTWRFRVAATNRV